MGIMTVVYGCIIYSILQHMSIISSILQYMSIISSPKYLGTLRVTITVINHAEALVDTSYG